MRQREDNMDGPQMESTAPEHVLRRRSSILAEQVLEAIRERDDEIFEETLHFDFLALGGGVAAGYWAETIAGSLSRRGRTAAIVSGDPEGLVPFERPALSKACLDPYLEGLRDFSDTNSGQFPFVCKGSGGPTHPLQWYKENDIAILAGCQAVFVDLDQKYVKVKRVIPSGSNDQLVFGDTIKVMFGRLLIATGVRPRRIGESPLNGMAKSLQGSCFCTRHPDLSGSPLELSHPDMFGFGSVHYVRDLGDTLKIVKAMTSIEADGQDTCKDPIVLVGGGFITCEVAAAIASHCPGMRLTMVVPGETIMSSVGFGKEICQFYEEQLARAGVDFAKGYRVNRLWRMEEEGSFPTLERTSQGSVLKKTSPRNFGPPDPHFTDSRGVVLFDKKTKEEVWLPARFVVLGIGSIPNSDLFKKTLDLSRDGGIVTDYSLRTSHPSGDIFAAGDVACSPVPLAGGDDVEGESTPKIIRFEHVKTARDMGKVAARAMLEGADTDESYDPVPYMYSRFLSVSWKFFGFTRGEACMVGMENYPSTRMFGAFWVFKGRIVGAFLEAGSESEVDHSATLERMAREQPPVLSMKRLRKCPLEKILSDPYCLAPPKLGVGEFHADTDISSIEETFQNLAKMNDKVKRADMAAVMKDLGADWDRDELADALESLDPSNSGFVHMQDFVRWWSN